MTPIQALLDSLPEFLIPSPEGEKAGLAVVPVNDADNEDAGLIGMSTIPRGHPFQSLENPFILKTSGKMHHEMSIVLERIRERLSRILEGDLEFVQEVIADCQDLHDITSESVYGKVFRATPDEDIADITRLSLHEIRPVLRTIFSYLPLYENGKDADSEGYELANRRLPRMTGGLKKATEFVDQLFKPGVVGSFRVSDFVLSHLKSLENMAHDDNVNLDIELIPDPGGSDSRDLDIHVDANLTLLLQIFRVIASNAIDAIYSKYVEEHGKPKKNGSPTIPGKLRLIIKPEGDYVAFTFQNSGVPIAEKSRSKIFDPGFSGGESKLRGGKGLGLSSSRAVIEKMGGIMDKDAVQNARSVEDGGCGGAEFTFKLKRSEGSLPEIKKTDPLR